MVKAIDYEKMTTEELGRHRNDLKRAYEAERDLSTPIYSRKVTADRDRDTEIKEGLPPGTIHREVAPPPIDMNVEAN